MNNGWISEIFRNLHGIRQSCPLSALLFVLSVEIMAEKVPKISISFIATDISFLELKYSVVSSANCEIFILCVCSSIRM
jgi:hypothetical protein